MPSLAAEQVDPSMILMSGGVKVMVGEVMSLVGIELACRTSLIWNYCSSLGSGILEL